MKRLLAVLVLLSSTACVNPVAPSYSCSTQPRKYTSPSGAVTWEIDHYDSPTSCPSTPIE